MLLLIFIDITFIFIITLKIANCLVATMGMLQGDEETKVFHNPP